MMLIRDVGLYLPDLPATSLGVAGAYELAVDQIPAHRSSVSQLNRATEQHSMFIKGPKADMPYKSLVQDPCVLTLLCFHSLHC